MTSAGESRDKDCQEESLIQGDTKHGCIGDGVRGANGGNHAGTVALLWRHLAKPKGIIGMVCLFISLVGLLMLVMFRLQKQSDPEELTKSTQPDKSVIVKDRAVTIINPQVAQLQKDMLHSSVNKTYGSWGGAAKHVQPDGAGRYAHLAANSSSGHEAVGGNHNMKKAGLVPKTSRAVTTTRTTTLLTNPTTQTPCRDTMKWKNKAGKDCGYYEHRGWCKNGNVSIGDAWTAGQEFEYPERHCVACGKCKDQGQSAFLLNQATASAWKVVSPTSVSVRMSRTVQSQFLGTKSKCSIVTGKQMGNWVKLSDWKRGYVAISIPGVTLLKAVTISFVRISKGMCQDIGRYPIVEPGLCAKAAKALGLKGARLYLAKATPKPEGCYWLHDESSLWLSVNPFNWGQGAIGPREPICSDQPPCYSARTCLAHTAFGEEYVSLSNAFTMPNKRRYSTFHGYTLVTSQQNSLEELIKHDFAGCFSGMTPWGMDLQTLLKVCSIFKAFRKGCNQVLWTDADAGIVTYEVPVHHFTEDKKDAHIYWSVSDIGAQGLCRTFPSSAGCISMEMFTSCLNSGAFIVKNTFWSEFFLLRVLTRSRFLNNPFCTTAMFNPARFDQCYIAGRRYGDQCAISCETKADRSLMAKMDCLGDHTSPVFQHLVGTQAWLPPFRGDTFVANCITKPKWTCVKYLASLPGFSGT